MIHFSVRSKVHQVEIYLELAVYNEMDKISEMADWSDGIKEWFSSVFNCIINEDVQDFQLSLYLFD